MQQAKQPFCTRLQLLAWLALNAGKHTGNQPTRLAHLDDGNDRAILVQGDEGPAQSLPQRRPGSFGWGIRALHQLDTATMVPFPRRLPHTISLLERDGFEPLVPDGAKLKPLAPGNGSSNPALSSGESHKPAGRNSLRVSVRKQTKPRSEVEVAKGSRSL